MLRAVRGRNISISVPVAKCALPSEMKPRRGRAVKVPAADSALPVEEKSSSTRGREIVPDVPDAPEVYDVPDAPAAPDAAVVALQVSGTQLGSHKICVTHEWKMSVDVDNTSVSTNDITPLTSRKHICEYCGSTGRCKKHCFTKRRRLRNVATKKSSGGSREPVDA